MDQITAFLQINIALMERFEKEGIEFAYPTQTVYLHKQT